MVSVGGIEGVKAATAHQEGRKEGRTPIPICIQANTVKIHLTFMIGSLNFMCVRAIHECSASQTHQVI